jgi:hypothetical protein
MGRWIASGSGESRGGDESGLDDASEICPIWCARLVCPSVSSPSIEGFEDFEEGQDRGNSHAPRLQSKNREVEQDSRAQLQHRTLTCRLTRRKDTGALNLFM